MVSKRHLRNLEIVLANGAILQWATRRCFMCGACGHHGHWECSNKYAIPYEEWAMIYEEEKKSSCDQFVNEEDVFDILVKDEDDVFVEEPASNAQEESHCNDSFLIHDDFVEEVVIEKASPEVIYSKEVISIEYYPLFGEGKSYFISEICLKQVHTRNDIMFWKLHNEVSTNSGMNLIIGGSLNFPFDPGIPK
ncbi:unnamed protein product [Cuscuta campestris]|uniref:Uncharacterized protein n=1 Tax=Cuscuta campestris TaxID=132261 RepID=A0A484MD14_9ASTE|nr:unnamed protein product [Cuscuta campestris]